MALKYHNQLKFSFNKLQWNKLSEYRYKTGMSCQDIIRKALDSFLNIDYEMENYKLKDKGKIR